MTFLRFCSGEHEWGFRVPDNYIPCVGDVVNLWYGLADTEGDDCVVGVVVKREWHFASDFISRKGGVDIWFTIELDSPIPEGYIADSTEWPSVEFTRRKEYAEEARRKAREQ